MRELLYQAYLRFPRAFYDQHATGQVVSRATNDLYPIRYFIGWGMVQGAQSLMMIIGVAVVLVLVNPKLAFLALLAMPLVGLLAWAFAQDGDAGLAARAAAQGRRDRGRGRGGRRDRDGAGVRPRGRRARALRRQGARRARRRAAPGADRGHLPARTALPADGVDRRRPLVRRPRRHPRTPDDRRVLPLLLAAAPARLAARGARLDHQPRPARDRVGVAQLRLARAHRPHPGAGQPAHAPRRAARRPLRERPLLVRHRHGGPERRRRRRAAGEIVAVCGPTGAGKTSLLNLLPRFYDPTSGRVLVGGVDVRDVPDRRPPLRRSRSSRSARSSSRSRSGTTSPPVAPTSAGRTCSPPAKPPASPSSRTSFPTATTR